MAISQAARRQSRGSTGPQRPGASMRVSKPSSANNSPRSSGALGRRRTMMADGSVPVRQRQAVDYLYIPHADMSLPPKQTSFRPLSWQPTSYMQQAQQQPPREQHAGYPFPTSSSSLYADAQDFYGAGPPHFSPMMASYSNETSPCSTFSPLPLLTGHDQAAYLQADAPDSSQRATPLYTPSSTDGQGMSEPFPALGGQMTSSRSLASGAAEWDAFVMQGYDNTSPRTPESFPALQHAPPAVSQQEAVPYAALDEAEEEGEILVGMGLYDAPDKFEEDPQLNNYRSTVSSLLGSSLRPQEPRGKGLKLEETWEPPKSDDEENDDDEDDDNDDAAGEDENEE
ncbi:hypothetical protein CDD83_5746 [Cordyceps sp. RAO-2017]|nr:hypothetical protein CDD83_5746 [Cordyceps sp. RAO-2017]